MPALPIRCDQRQGPSRAQGSGARNNERPSTSLAADLVLQRLVNMRRRSIFCASAMVMAVLAPSSALAAGPTGGSVGTQECIGVNNAIAAQLGAADGLRGLAANARANYGAADVQEWQHSLRQFCSRFP